MTSPVTCLSPPWIIERKRDGAELTDEEIRFFVDGFTRGSVPDYQMSALAMAIFFRGMTPRETAALTRAMMESGDVVDTSGIPGVKVDKHSTGGVGDKVSLILAPLAAACGAVVPMISGRGLGITGGTLDKLESIPGYRCALDQKEFLAILHRCGCSMIGQTERLVPADRKLYALRDVSGTVPSIPLITASIMSKKLAEGIDALVMDIKCGRGAFMKNVADARALARSIITVGHDMGKPVRALITDMHQPLGHCAGNALEMAEACAALQGHGPADLMELTLALTSTMLRMTELAASEADARELMRAKIADGSAWERFLEMVRLHGGDTTVLEHPERLPQAPVVVPFPAPANGWVELADAEIIGRTCVMLGAGRRVATDKVDHAVGISGLCKLGGKVARGHPLAVIHARTKEAARDAAAMLADAFRLAAQPVVAPSLILGEEGEM